MADEERHVLGERAQEVLARNRRGAWTCPSAGFYPHQWLWDSCFVAIGLARTDPNRAAGELQAMLRGQWANGMVPHIVFAEGVRDVGSERIWQSKRNPLAPRDVDTSCITQPPLLAVAARRVADALPRASLGAFLADVVPKIVRYHQWLYRERDLLACGLVTLIHPWECGLDTTPPWMSAMTAMSGPWWLRLAVQFRLERIVRAFRRDTRLVPAAQRASDDDGLRMLALAQQIRAHGFELRRLPASGSVVLEDLAFNALLVVANQALERIAADAGVPIDAALVTRFRTAETALEALWDDSAGEYRSRDASTGELIGMSTVATFLPLWAGVASPDQTRQLVTRLRDPGFWPAFPVPSVPTDAPEFEADRYWKGPTWVNVNWMIVQGLAACGEHETAEELRRRTLDLVEGAGFAEYFSALTGHAIGIGNFSWTAALTLDLLATRPSPE